MFNYYFMCSDVLIFCFGYEQMEFFFSPFFVWFLCCQISHGINEGMPC
jgi:hypothetical protein